MVIPFYLAIIALAGYGGYKFVTGVAGSPATTPTTPGSPTTPDRPKTGFNLIDYLGLGQVSRPTLIIMSVAAVALFYYIWKRSK